MWLPSSGKTLKGKRTAWENVLHGTRMTVAGRLLDGITLEGSEKPGRVVRKEAIFPDTGRRTDLEGRRKPRPWRERRTSSSASADRNTRRRPRQPHESGAGSR